MKRITLITDWNEDDYFVGAVKGYMLSHCPDIKLVEISHRVPLFDIQKAAFILKSCYGFYPDNTVHISGVRGFNNRKSALPVAVSYKGQYFFGFDNKAFISIFDSDENPEMWMLNNQDSTFPELDLLLKPAVKLLNGVDINTLGTLVSEMPFVAKIRPEKSAKFMVGNVMYINGYGNAVTNITRKTFEDFVEGKQFSITVLRRQNEITKISAIIDSPEGELFAIFNTLGLLEIGQMNYRLDESVGVGLLSKIRIEKK